jgi:hypothetical protein
MALVPYIPFGPVPQPLASVPQEAGEVTAYIVMPTAGLTISYRLAKPPAGNGLAHDRSIKTSPAAAAITRLIQFSVKLGGEYQFRYGNGNWKTGVVPSDATSYQIPLLISNNGLHA